MLRDVQPPWGFGDNFCHNYHFQNLDTCQRVSWCCEDGDKGCAVTYKWNWKSEKCKSTKTQAAADLPCRRSRDVAVQKWIINVWGKESTQTGANVR